MEGTWWVQGEMGTVWVSGWLEVYGALWGLWGLWGCGVQGVPVPQDTRVRAVEPGGRGQPPGVAVTNRLGGEEVTHALVAESAAEAQRWLEAFGQHLYDLGEPRPPGPPQAIPAGVPIIPVGSPPSLRALPAPWDPPCWWDPVPVGSIPKISGTPSSLWDPHPGRTPDHPCGTHPYGTPITPGPQTIPVRPILVGPPSPQDPQPSGTPVLREPLFPSNP